MIGVVFHDTLNIYTKWEVNKQINLCWKVQFMLLSNNILKIYSKQEVSMFEQNKVTFGEMLHQNFVVILFFNNKRSHFAPAKHLILMKAKERVSAANIQEWRDSDAGFWPFVGWPPFWKGSMPRWWRKNTSSIPQGNRSLEEFRRQRNWNQILNVVSSKNDSHFNLFVQCIFAKFWTFRFN